MTREEAIDVLKHNYPSDCFTDLCEAVEIAIQALSAQPEPCEDKLKEIADALSEKMSYMNTCPNERDIILSYLGRKRSSKNHCNTDCWNEKCESYHYETKQQPEPCELCSNLEKGDTLYQSSDWDGGIGFDYIWDIQYCPKCGRRLE